MRSLRAKRAVAHVRCRICKARFSERKGTPLFGSALPQEKVRSILEHIAEGCGVRETSRLRLSRAPVPLFLGFETTFNN